ncbi:hypothetical protein KRX51_02375 [Corynebacterium sp. TAE3-ERU12]|uniref:hypothetical protein n=1 Tax=Corynebacterium sp. TAE3-ERU12 TaxID=2849491 RepID=UPI001C443799|nr:hypothetical protein [Corynebacterium sp. TAE3-ERU12]MBV7294766.1 hypothetical protein [Corynebacterium sp. TAE3-ERU12]
MDRPTPRNERWQDATGSSPAAEQDAARRRARNRHINTGPIPIIPEEEAAAVAPIRQQRYNPGLILAGLLVALALVVVAGVVVFSSSGSTAPQQSLVAVSSSETTPASSADAADDALDVDSRRAENRDRDALYARSPEIANFGGTGYDHQGWQYSDAHCDNQDIAQAVLRTSSFDIVVCSLGADYYYRSADADGTGGITLFDVAKNGSSYSVRNGGVRYVVSADGIRIYHNGELVDSESAQEWHERD